MGTESENAEQIVKDAVVVDAAGQDLQVGDTIGLTARIVHIGFPEVLYDEENKPVPGDWAYVTVSTEGTTLSLRSDNVKRGPRPDEPKPEKPEKPDEKPKHEPKHEEHKNK